MSETTFPPFLKRSEYKSTDEKHPDTLSIKVLETETFETEYSINVRAEVNGEEKIIPLHTFESRNNQLVQKWNDGIKSGKIKVGRKFKIKTWLGTSKNGHPIRRYELVF